VKGIIDLINSLGPFITAATPILVPVVMWLITRAQSKDLKAHSDSNREAINNQIAATSGTYKAISEK
jgi:uncharacterized Tic20 family protein